jgi:endoglucanase Acf2
LKGDWARSSQIFARQQGAGTYWTGKALSATAQLMAIAEQAGMTEMRNDLLKVLKSRMEDWFVGKGNGYFLYNAQLGTVVGYPDEFGSMQFVNDHHFHYGYWINAAAQIALRDAEWARSDQWGGMVEKLIADIANPTRNDRFFPFIRNFDAYEGHGWASGDANFPDGNNQEASSESINAWAALILWAEATHNLKLRDLGIWLYTTETESVSDYWFDTRHQVFSGDYKKPVAAQVFGGRYSYNTWWTEEPRQIQGINLLPITPASVYLAKDKTYIRNFFASLETEKQRYIQRGGNDGTPPDIWQDVLVSFEALADPELALSHWKPRGSVELGETRSHTMHWLYSLQEMGTPDFSVQANVTFYGVFKNTEGKKTYLAYNPGSSEITVQYTDGTIFKVPAGALVRH